MSPALKSSLFALLLVTAGCPSTPPAASSASGAPSAEIPPGSEPTVTNAAPAPSAEKTDPKPEADEEAVKTLFVHPSRVDCEGGAGPMRCLQVRESPEEDWIWFYDTIEGFDHEEGHRYELRVEVTPVDNPPADASRLRYRLVEVVSKDEAAP